jgi:hypothetical protein
MKAPLCTEQGQLTDMIATFSVGSSPFLSIMCEGKGLEGYYPIGALDFLCVSGFWHLMPVLFGGVVFKARICVHSVCFVGLVWLMVGCSVL